LKALVGQKRSFSKRACRCCYAFDGRDSAFAEMISGLSIACITTETGSRPSTPP
jgi:hypothetical protein